MHADDQSSYNVVRDNTITTFGSECFDVKENAHDNVFEGNVCRANDEPTDFSGSAVELRGYRNKVLGNAISQSRGYGVKISSDSDSFSVVENVVRGNTFASVEGPVIYYRGPIAQEVVCGNSFGREVAIAGDAAGLATAACAGP
jgi:hypothetical protein